MNKTYYYINIGNLIIYTIKKKEKKESTLKDIYL